MDIQKERELFELSFKETDFSKMNLVNCFCFITDRYVWDEVQAAWEMWQTAIARMEVRINTLDEMLLNQGEALAQAKAQAVPEGFVLIKASDRDQEMLELIDQRDHMESQAEELKDKLQALYGVDFGEHSSCNFPFQNAIDYDDSDLVLVPKEPTDKTIARMINTPIEVNLLCDHADIFLSEGEAYIAYQAMIEAQEPAND